MIVLAPISPLVQSTLYKKIAMLSSGAGKSIGKDENGNWTANSTTANGTVSDNVENYMFVRTPYMRMTSLTPTDENTPLIIQGGEMDSTGNLISDFSQKYRTSLMPVEDASNTVDAEIREEMPFRPLAGVKDIAIEYKGGGMKLGATRESTINWSCWSWEELERLTQHFLAPRRSVFLEWGWSGIGELKRKSIYDLYTDNRDDGLKFDIEKITGLNSALPRHIQDQGGNYDAMLGLITSFDWSVNETGGFDCSTVLVGQGVSILQSQQKGNKYAKYESMGLLGPRKNVKITDVLTGTVQERKLSKWQDILKARSPYITFREYMSDFRQQLKFTYTPADQQQPIICIPACKALGQVLSWKDEDEKSKDFFKGWKGKGRDNKAGKMSFGFTPEDQYFCTWGWFEDNVLSRFFGKVTKRGGKDVLLSEFRSISQMVNQDGTLMFDGVIPINQANGFRGSKYLITVDSTKWLIPKSGDPMLKFLMVVGKDNGFTAQKKYGTDDDVPLQIRDIVFNGGYLSEKLKGSSDIVRSVLGIWDEFSKVYGGVYKFKVEFDDSSNRLSLVEEGYSNFKVEDLLAGVKDKGLEKKPSGPKLFVFPAMEHGSIVKTQTLNAKLPDRMKLAAMYGVKNPTPEDQAETDYDKLSALAWGRLSSTKPPDTTEMTQTEKQKKVYDDHMTGKIDFPSRGNRDFGHRYADIHEDIYIGPILDDEPSPAAGGSIIRVSILDDLDQSQQAYMKSRKGQQSQGEESPSDEEANPSAMEDMIESFNENFIFNTNSEQGGEAHSNFYTANWKYSERPPPDLEVDENEKEPEKVEPPELEKKPYVKGKMKWDSKWLQKAIDGGVYRWDLIGDSEIYPDYHETVENNYKQIFQAILDHDDIDAKDRATVETWEKAAEPAYKTPGQLHGPNPLIHPDNTASTEDLENRVSAGEEEQNNFKKVAKFSGRELTGKEIGTIEWAKKNNLGLSPNEVGLIIGKSNTEDTNVDNWITEMEINYKHYAYVLLKPELLYELQKKLRGDKEHGVIPKTNPLIPVDFEMEIDGTGGLFPGNSFHSSYFSSRYKEESVFQMVGVNHTIDSSGWSTTVKGQIRSVAVAAVEPDVEDKTDETDESSGEPIEGDTGDTDIQGAKQGNPFVGITLGKANTAAQNAGLEKFWWTNEPGVYSSGDDTRSNGRNDYVLLGETGEVAAW